MPSYERKTAAYKSHRIDTMNSATHISDYEENGFFFWAAEFTTEDKTEMKYPVTRSVNGCTPNERLKKGYAKRRW